MSVYTLNLKSRKYKAVVCVGKRRMCKNFQRKVDAEKWISEIKTQDNSSVIDDITLASFINLWFQRYAEVKKAPSSILRDRELAKHVISFFHNTRKLGEITVSEVEHFLSRKIRELSPGTCNRIRSFLHKIYSDAIKWRFVKSNPISAISRFHELRKPPTYWTSEEIIAFLNCSKNNQYHDVFKFALNTGMRMGEILALKWDAINFDRRTINVFRTYDNVSKDIKDYCKSRRYRCIGMNSAILEVSVKLRQDKYPLVFHDGNGNVIKPRSLQHAFRRCNSASGAKRIRFHDLRHSYGSHYMMNGGNAYDLMHLMGHSDIKVTEIYAHLSHDHISQKASMVNFEEKPLLKVIK